MLEKFRTDTDTAALTRRTVLGAFGAMGGLLAAGTTMTVAQTDQELDLTVEIYAEEEFITITNNGDESADLTGYSINFDAEGGNDQIRQLSGDVTIESGGTITVPTGAREVSGESVVHLEDPYDGEVLNNDGSDIVEVLDQDLSPVASSDPAGPPRDEEPQDGTGIVRVVNQDGVPVKGETVWISPEGTVENSARQVRYTDPDTGTYTIEVSGLLPSDVSMFTIEVRDQEQHLGIAPDEEHGTQEVVFEVDSIGNEGNPTVVTAIDAETTEPIEGASVAIDEEGGDPATNESWDFETDEFGRVEEDLDIGSYIVRVSKDGYEDANGNVSLENYFHAELEKSESDESDDSGGSDDTDDSETGSDDSEGGIGDGEPSDDSEELEQPEEVPTEGDSGQNCP